MLPDVSIGGGQTIVLHHVRHADRSRYDIRLSTLRPGGELVGDFAEAGCPPIDIDHHDGRGAQTVGRLVGLVRREQIDLLHVHSVLDFKYGQLAALLTGTPVVAHLHSCWDHLGPRLPEGAGAARRARSAAMGIWRDGVERRVVRRYVAESRTVEQLFTGRVSAPIDVVQQSVASDRIGSRRASATGHRLRAELGLSGATPLILNVSRLDAGKGHADLVRTMATLVRSHPSAVLVLVGDGEQRRMVEGEVERRGLASHVRLLGSRLDVPELLSAADLFVFASYGEGFGLAVLEAMAARLPVVAYRLPSLGEFALERITALLADPGDVGALARGLARLADDPSLARAMGAAGRALVEARFPADAVARSFERAYDAVLEDHFL